ncbi:MAG: leucine--tRNA ligase [Candidatus Woesearchaeota archaeon]
MELNFFEIEKKWQKKWQEDKIFYANPDSSKKKYFLTSPYPYVNGLLHLGHAVTALHPDTIARYKRMRGYNVLWAYAFHATGAPITVYAEKIKQRDAKQIELLKRFVPDLDEEKLKFFENPENWVKYFIQEAKKDLYGYGFSLDTRRHFFTTYLNDTYDSFIRWQFNKLKEKGYVISGSYPIVFCPNCNASVPDHARSEGEGETTQEFNGLKFKFNYKGMEVYLIAATLRPETVFGQTNFWINPDVDYVLIDIEYDLDKKHFKEKWIVSKRSAEKLSYQNYKVQIVETFKGKELVGKKCVAPYIDREIPILPGKFVDENYGTGLVTSVPSDAPHDYQALKDLQNNPEECKKYGLNYEEVKSIELIPIIDSKELGTLPAKKICEEWQIKDQNDPRLEEAKKLVYQAGFYEGTMLINCKEFAGMKVNQAKDLVAEKLRDLNLNVPIYELTGKVVCRCGTEAIAAILQNQWFLDYSNPEWKKLAKECVEDMKFNDESVRQQILNTIDWLKQWPCARLHGLGTSLPWQKEWVIESLSDSTIYMAFYTLAPYLQHPQDYGWNLNKKLEDDFFDLIFLKKGSKEEIKVKYNIPDGLIERMQEEFDYWYCFDYRNSAKDLIQNHLTFLIFNHVAIFPREKWPKCIYDINGYVKVGTQKMSKSKGNFKTLRDLLTAYGADVTRLTSLYAGEGLDDPTFELEFFDVAREKLLEINSLVNEIENLEYSEERTWVEEFAEERINQLISEITDALENFRYRTYVQKLYFEYVKIYYEYKRICESVGKKLNKQIVMNFSESLIKMMQPATPHLAEELWHRKHSNYVSLESWPEYEKLIGSGVFKYNLAMQLIEDIKNIKQLAKLEKINKITLIVAKTYKYEMFKEIKRMQEQEVTFNEMLKQIASKYGKYDQSIAKNFSKLIKSVPEILDKDLEMKSYEELKSYIAKIFDATVEIKDADVFDHQKSNLANPLKPAILVE